MQLLMQCLRSSTAAQVRPNTCGQPSLSGADCNGSRHGRQGQEAQVANVLGQEQKWQQVAEVKFVEQKWNCWAEVSFVEQKWNVLSSSSSIRTEEIHWHIDGLGNTLKHWSFRYVGIWVLASWSCPSCFPLGGETIQNTINLWWLPDFIARVKLGSSLLAQAFWRFLLAGFPPGMGKTRPKPCSARLERQVPVATRLIQSIFTFVQLQVLGLGPVVGFVRTLPPRLLL